MQTVLKWLRAIALGALVGALVLGGIAWLLVGPEFVTQWAVLGALFGALGGLSVGALGGQLMWWQGTIRRYGDSVYKSNFEDDETKRPPM